jgi:predicted ATP-dependent Lon-type protease
MVQIWDVVGFDEVADLQKMPKEVITTLKTYCESGQFQRGQEAVSGYASIAMFGNTQQPIDVMVQTGHLFAPMPDVIRDDMAFIDRLHFYLPAGKCRRCATSTSPTTTASSSTTWPRPCASCASTTSPRSSTTTSRLVRT